MRFGPVLLFAGLLAAQTPPAAQDKCGVEGTVLNSANGQPVPRAMVTLRSLVRIPPSSASFNVAEPAAASSNADGKFVFKGLAPGSYQIFAQRDNFQYAPQRRVEPLALKAGDEKTGVVVQLTPLGAVAGHVQNEEGDPLPNVQVNVMVYEYTPEGRQLLPRNGAQTNDLGDYRIFGLLSGKYVLRAARAMGRLPAGEEETYIPLYYPGASDASGAAPVDLAAGQDMRGVDFTLRRVRGVTVRGHVAKPAGAPMVSVLLSAGNGAMGGINNATNDPEGKFELRGVTPGAYTLTARTNVANKVYMAERSLQVGGDDIEGIDLTLAPPVDVSGALRIEGDAPDVKFSQMQVSLQAPRQGNQGRPNDDGTFAIRNLQPEVYRPLVNVTQGGPLFIKAVRCGTTDVTESGIDLTSGAGCDLTITLSANGGQIDGQVQDDAGNPAPGAMVTLAPVGRQREDLFKVAGTDASGHYKIPNLAPGNYRLYAWEEVDTNAVRYDPDFIKPFESKGQNVQISEGDKQTVSLKLIAKPAEP